MLTITENTWDQLKPLMMELKPTNTEDAELRVILDRAKLTFPISSVVEVLNTGYTARVVRYNTRLGGFYPGIRYPIMVELLTSEDEKFQSSVGMIFEYSMDQLKLL